MDPSASSDAISEIKKLSAYTIDPGTEGLITERRTLLTAQHNGQEFTPGSQTSFVLRTGEYAFDGANSYFQFRLKLQNPGTRPRLNPLGAAALIDRVQFESANGLVLFNHLQYKVMLKLLQNVDPYTVEKYADAAALMEESASNYEQKRNDNFDGHYNPLNNYTPPQAQFMTAPANTAVGMILQLHLWGTMLKQSRFFPAMLTGPIKVTITWAPYRDAFLEDAVSTGAPSSYTISDFKMVQALVKFSQSFTDKIELTIQARSEAGGLPMVQQSYWHTENVLNSDINYVTLDLNKTAANATSIITVMQPQELAQSSGFPHVDKLTFSPCGVYKYQWRIASNFLPQQPVETPTGGDFDYERFYMEADMCWKQPNQKNALNKMRYAPRIAVKDSSATTTSVCPGYIRIGPANDTFYYRVIQALGSDVYIPTNVGDDTLATGTDATVAYRVNNTGLQPWDAVHGMVSSVTRVLSVELPHGVWPWEYICNIIRTKAVVPSFFDFSLNQDNNVINGSTANYDAAFGGVNQKVVATAATDLTGLRVPIFPLKGSNIHNSLFAQTGKPLFSKVAIEVEETTGLCIFVLARSAACYSQFSHRGGATSVANGYNDTGATGGLFLCNPELIPCLSRSNGSGHLNDGGEQVVGGNFLHTFGIRSHPFDGGASTGPVTNDISDFMMTLKKINPYQVSAVSTNYLGAGAGTMTGQPLYALGGAWPGLRLLSELWSSSASLAGADAKWGPLGSEPSRVERAYENIAGYSGITTANATAIPIIAGNALPNGGAGYGIMIRNTKPGLVQFMAPEAASSAEVDLTAQYQNPNNMLDACVRIGPGAAPNQPSVGRTFGTLQCLPGAAGLSWYERTKDFHIGLCLQDAPGVMMSGRPTSLDAVPKLELFFRSNDVIFNGSRLNPTPDSLVSAVRDAAGTGSSSGVAGQGRDSERRRLLSQNARRILSLMFYTAVLMVQPGKTMTIRE